MKQNIFLACIAILLLFAFKQTEITKITSVTLAETSKSWNGEDLPNYPDGKPKITVLKITIPSGMKLNIHKHLVINAGVLTKGELTVVDDKNNFLILRAGEALVELVNTYHSGENKGNSAAEIIVFYAGTVDLPITVTKTNELSDH